MTKLENDNVLHAEVLVHKDKIGRALGIFPGVVMLRTKFIQHVSLEMFQ